MGGPPMIVRSPVTIWVEVEPNSTNGDAAFDTEQKILKLLKDHDIDDIDVAFYEQ